MRSRFLPSKVISDQYGSKIVTKKDGSIAVGLVVESDAGVTIYNPDPSSPPTVVKQADIESIEASPISQMPTGLINSLNAEELRDLIAYLLSGGNKRSSVFRE
jgi:putative heme-binding domain-containing protein